MRIFAPGTAVTAGARREGVRSGPAGVFGLGRPGPSAAAAVGGAGPALAPSALDALMALQALPDAADRRRSTRRGGRLLDALEEVRLALLDGQVAPSALAALRDELGVATAAPTGDPGLDDLLREIEVRAAVELAKLELAGAAGPC